MRDSIPKFLSGVYGFTGAGYDKPTALSEKLTYLVPADRRTQLVYLRGGNSCDALIYLALMRDGQPMRYFPLGAKAAEHVPLAVVEDLFPDSKIEVFVAAPAGTSGHVVLDIGLVEI